MSENRAEYRRGLLTEWYINDASGLEQGFTLHSRPQPEGASAAAPLTLALRMGGTLHPTFASDGQAVDLRGTGSLGGLRYAGLRVTDASGRLLPSRIEAIPGGLAIVVEDGGAAYPVTVDPVVSASLIFRGYTSYCRFGDSVSTAGDVNGDGFDDIIIGSYRYAGTESEEGAAYLFLGSAAGPSTSPAWSAESNQANAHFGQVVATAGDVNGDGYADILVGAPDYTNGQASEGAVFVWYGSATGLGVNGTPANADRILETNIANASFGFAAACAGDVNDDGYSDVIVGDYSYTGAETGEGKAYVYLGSATGLAATAAWTAESNQANALLGCAVGTAGDVNGDGFSDIAVGASGYTNGQGSEGGVFVWYGSASGLGASGTPANAGWHAESDTVSSGLGASVGTAGDVNGDGYADLIVGAPEWDEGAATSAGRAFLYLGSAAGLAATPSWQVGAATLAANYGYSVSTAGDINGDGYADVVVGAPGTYNVALWAGIAYVFLGSSGGLGATAAYWTAPGLSGDARQSGHSVATAGDTNGDGFSEILVGAPLYDPVGGTLGGVFLYFGGWLGPAAASWTAESDQGSAHLGASLASAGDVNGDGYGDVVIGAPDYDNGQSDEGRAFLYLGSATGLTATAAWTAESDQASAHMGKSVASAGDVNGDGYGDVIVGAPDYDNGQSNEGRVSLFLGSAAGLGAAAAWTAEADLASSGFGTCVASAGDVNGDGYSDVVVGSPLLSNGESSEGRAFVYLGSVTGLATTAAWMVESDQANARFGVSVSTAGDVNRDGYSDLIVGANLFDNVEADEGRAFVFLGSASGLGTSPVWTAESDQAIGHLGWSVATAGDVNGDGYSDVLVSADYYTSGETREGAIFLWYGSASGLGPNGTPANADWRAESNQASAYFGTSLASGLDVNWDGFSDVAAGAPNYDNPEVNEGAVFLWYGSASGLGASGTPANAVWSVESNLASALMGSAVAAAGDVNGDGFGDLLVGASQDSNGQTYEGRAFLYWGNGYWGNGAGGAAFAPHLRRADGSAPIAPLGRAPGGDYQISVLGRTIFGRGQVKLEWQALPLGTAFSIGAIAQSRGESWTDTGVVGAAITQGAPLVGPDGPYCWRARQRYRPSTTPFQRHGPWFTSSANALRETDLRKVPVCVPPTLAVTGPMVTKSGADCVLTFQDSNAANQRTGWNIRRSTDASTAKSGWPLAGNNVPDGNPGTVTDIEWTDTSGSPAAGTVWYYQVTTYNANCPAEGPFL